MIEDDLRRRVEKHDRDLYQGNGKPALTVRMALVEKEVETVKEVVDEIKKDSKATRNMVLAAILAIAGDIVVKLVMH